MSQWNRFEETLARRGISPQWALDELGAFKIELPAWAFGDARTRFALFRQEGTPRNILEKLEDVAQVNRYTGAAPSVALNVLSDCDRDTTEMRAAFQEYGLLVGAMNPIFFTDERYRFGSVCNEDLGARRHALEHMRYSVELGRALGSKIQSLWIPDGTNYPGQGDFRRKRGFLRDFLTQTYRILDPDVRMLVEYKLYEPAFYHTDLSDWGTSVLLCKELGPRAQVLVDLGHHAHGVNVEHIVALLLDEQKLGGFHLNGRKSADDDLITGSQNPYELFLICKELIDAGLDEHTALTARNVAYMIDQSHCIEPKIPAMILSVTNAQIAYAKALTLDRRALRAAQEANDVIAAAECVRAAFETDVTPLLHAVREQAGAAADPLAAYLQSGFERKRAAARG